MPVHRSPSPRSRISKPRRKSSLVIIAVEGVTESNYFGSLRQRYHNSRIREVVIFPPIDGKSDPRYVLNNLRSIIQERGDYSIGFDSLWIVIDVDGRPDKILSDVCQEARTLGAGVAISNPCFDLWLYLHLADLDDQVQSVFWSDNVMERSQNVKAAYRREKALRSKSGDDYEVCCNSVPDAVSRSSALDCNPQLRWPMSLGTRVYRLIQEMDDLAAPTLCR